MQLASPAPSCLYAAGKWTACPASGNWNVPENIWGYLVARSSDAVYGNGGVPRRVIKLAAYYALGFSMKEEVVKYYGNAGAKEAALAEFAGRPDTRVLSDGKKVYFVSGDKVIEVQDAGLAATTGKVMSGVSGGRLDAAVGCAMNAVCWNGLGTALEQQAYWLAAEAAKEKEKAEDAPAEEG
jgi:fructose-1,6-bisphosphatase/sedoheptulose 1,7-bisphosphatase-like protein